MLSTHRRLPLAVALVLASLKKADAQITSNATCLPSLAALYNSEGQSPCLVAAYLGGACNGGQYDVSALLPDQHYIGPTAAIANQCQCSTVMYSMMGGCSACQNATIISWASWSTSCTSVFVDIFPQDIPANTAVPGWAFDNVTITGTFDPQAALAETSLPESTATHVQSTQTAVSGSATASSGSSTSSAAPASKKSSSNAGAIAGGVVGGVVGLALIALIAFLLIKRSKNRRTAGPGMINGGGSPVLQEKIDPQYQAVPYAPTPMSPPPGGFVAQQQTKLYDPNDPSTFPTSPAPQTLDSQYSGPTLYNQTQFGTPQMPQAPPPQTFSTNNQGMYRGVAEV